MMAPCQEPLAEITSRAVHHAPTIKMISTCDPEGWSAGRGPDPAYWARQLVEPVNFSGAITRLKTMYDSCIIVEVGPGRALGTLASRNGLSGPDWPIVATLPGPAEPGSQAIALTTAVGRIWESGGAIDWVRFREPRVGRLTSLPGYPFAKTRFWLDDPDLLADRSGAAEGNGLVKPRPSSELKCGVSKEPPAGAEPSLGSILEIVASVVRAPIAQIDSDAAFVALGIDSLHLSEIAQQSRDRFGVAVTVADILERAPSPRSLFALIAELPRAAVSSASLVGSRRQAARQPTAQAALRKRRSEDEPQFGAKAKAKAFLEGWIPRYNLRTARSKEHAARHRNSHADPRGSVGFTGSLKDVIYPIVAESGEGARFIDLDGNEYVDLAMGFGTLLFGHLHVRRHRQDSR